MEPYFEDYLLNLGELHNDILNVLKDLPPEALDWSPGQDVNSLTVLVAWRPVSRGRREHKGVDGIVIQIAGSNRLIVFR